MNWPPDRVYSRIIRAGKVSICRQLRQNGSCLSSDEFSGRHAAGIAPCHDGTFERFLRTETTEAATEQPPVFCSMDSVLLYTSVYGLLCYIKLLFAACRLCTRAVQR